MKESRKVEDVCASAETKDTISLEPGNHFSKWMSLSLAKFPLCWPIFSKQFWGFGACLYSIWRHPFLNIMILVYFEVSLWFLAN